MDNITGQLAFTESKLEEYLGKKVEGIKDQNDKIDYSEVDFDILDLMAKRFAANKHKYPEGNMLKPIEEKSLMFAMFRHWKKILNPVENDPESFEDHIAAIFCNAQMVLQQRKLNSKGPVAQLVRAGHS
jgi:hypothetical protein